MTLASFKTLILSLGFTFNTSELPQLQTSYNKCMGESQMINVAIAKYGVSDKSQACANHAYDDVKTHEIVHEDGDSAHSAAE